MTIDLKKMEEKLDKLLSDETEESFREWLESKRLLPQQEISDEEIEKAALKWCKDIGEDGYVNSGDDYDIHELSAYIAGAKWYREQFKLKKINYGKF